ncbi:hypothetical protein C491_19404 [Natronococcus amylolyticus DSM 10524]|uniref:Uncharacterized protein n=1 Tax=Natronococcus amylolyticus DSM 10524 TaxID=1227497 RepID=L9WY19_9EURY|nr:hypothetical protein C491_19404 [Natronococcus amylolyticus DSM 10524]
MNERSRSAERSEATAFALFKSQPAHGFQKRLEDPEPPPSRTPRFHDRVLRSEFLETVRPRVARFDGELPTVDWRE